MCGRHYDRLKQHSFDAVWVLSYLLVSVFRLLSTKNDNDTRQRHKTETDHMLNFWVGVLFGIDTISYVGASVCKKVCKRHTICAGSG